MPKMMFSAVPLILSVVLTATTCSGAGRQEFVADGPLQHLAVDWTSQTLFLGATNYLYQLNADDLRPVQPAVVVGPVNDHRQCTEQFGEERCSAGGTLLFDATPTDNINKVLVVDHQHRQLITCGSVFQVQQTSTSRRGSVFAARRRISYGPVSVCLSVCHKSEF